MTNDLAFFFGGFTFLLMLIGLSPMGQTVFFFSFISIVGIPIGLLMMISPTILIFMAVVMVILYVERFTDYPLEVMCGVLALMFGGSVLVGQFAGAQALLPHIGLDSGWNPSMRWWVG